MTSSMFIQPFFDYKPEEWLAMVYAWPKKIEPDSSFVIGFAFKTERYAKEFFDLLRAYNDGDSTDNNNNIRLSLITENPTDYSVYIYPSNERKNIINFMKETEKKFGEDNELLILNLTLCKQFPYGEGSSFKRFKELYIKGNPVELYPFLLKDGNRPEVIKSIEPIIKYDIKIEHRKLLKKEDPEYQHGKDIIGLK
ncbi:hypothetical protein [Caldifermentibacillus hisashii]|uniref:hypothetical protein n=1 Tax=Caldifermentibacillus hisashii TaxID=996558 RepID=UPI0031B6BDC6